jgi:hypothetical protein
LGFVGFAHAQSSVMVSRNQDLSFGSMVVVHSGSLVLNPQTGVLGGTASVLRPTMAGYSVAPAEFVITCSSSTPIMYTVQLDHADTLLTASDLNTFTVFSSLNGNPDLGTPRSVDTCTGYSETVKVGATLMLNSSSPAGTYAALGGATITATITP